jgi:hypothetical protein
MIHGQMDRHGGYKDRQTASCYFFKIRKVGSNVTIQFMQKHIFLWKSYISTSQPFPTYGPVRDVSEDS